MGAIVWQRRSVLAALGVVGASVWLAPTADALGLADDKIKRVRYFRNSGDSTGNRGQLRWRWSVYR